MKNAPTAGFALLIALVAMLAIVAIGAAALAISAATGTEQLRVVEAQELFENLTGSTTGIGLFQDNINGKTPGALSQLRSPITSSQKDICGAFYTTGFSGADADEWGGRYASRIFTSGGVPIDIGVLQDTLELEQIGNSYSGILRVTSVTEEEARRLDARVDDGDGSSVGTVRWTAVAADGTVTLRWVFAMDTACNVSPSAAFTASCTQLTCNFTSTSTDSDGTIAAYSWTFGDASTATTQNPSRTYAAGGTYVVSLTVTDNQGGQGNTSQNVTVRNYTLTAVAQRQGQNRWTDMTWGGALTANIDVYRNNVLIVTTPNDGVHTDVLPGAGTYMYRICEQSTAICSATVTTSIN